MKITIQDQPVTYSYDWSTFDNEEGVYCPTAEEAVNAALDLLGCAYTREEIAKVLRQKLPAMEY